MSRQTPEPENKKTTSPKSMSIDDAFQHGVSLYQHNQRNEARAIFEQILTAAPNAVPVLQVLAVMDKEDNAWQQALQKLDNALALEPKNSSLLFDKATILLDKGFTNEAILLVQTLLEQHPKQPEILQLHQQLQMKIGKKKTKPLATASAAPFSEKTQLSEEITKTFELAQKMLSEGNDKQATFLFKAVLSLAPTHIAALIGLAKLQIKAEEFAQAKQHLLQAYQSQAADKELVVLLAHCDIHIGQYKSARQRCLEGIAQWPLDPLFYRLQISSYEKEKNWLAAFEAGEKAISLFPENADLLCRFATASFMQLKARHNFTAKKIQACEQHILQAQQVATPEKQQLLSTYLAEVLWYKGEAKRAKILLEDYIQHHPDDLDAGFTISFIYRSLADWPAYYRSNELGIECGARMHYQGDLPRWDLTRAKTDVVLVMPEQGIGDELFYFHNLKLVLDNAKKVYLLCEPRLSELVTLAFPAAKVIPIKREKDKQIDIPADAMQEITSWIASGSLARICYAHLQRHFYQEAYIPTINRQYAQLTQLKQDNPDAHFVGVCWRSGLQDASRNLHYLSVQEIAYFTTRCKKTIFINLQYGECKKEIKKIEKLTNIPIHRIKDVDLQDDFIATAALIQQLDAVLTAGTAIHRLTSAVGTPCFVFFAGTEDSTPTKPVALFSASDIGYFYPPLLENKRPMLAAIAKDLNDYLASKSNDTLN